jgi:hypothetical protein
MNKNQAKIIYDVITNEKSEVIKMLLLEELSSFKLDETLLVFYLLDIHKQNTLKKFVSDLKENTHMLGHEEVVKVNMINRLLREYINN